jgi:hypothetical protein
VTRFRITLHCWEAIHLSGRTRGQHSWIRMSEFENFPLSVTGRKISRLLTENEL